MVIKLPTWPRKDCHKLAFSVVSKLTDTGISIERPNTSKEENTKHIFKLELKPYFINVCICKSTLG